MSLSLFVMVEAGGNVPVQLSVARRLRARGHKVRVLGDEALAREARAADCEFSPFRTLLHHNVRNREADRIRDWEPRSPVKQLARFTRQVMFGPAAAYAREVLDELERAPADVLAIDFLLFGAQIGAEKSGLPMAVLMHTPYSLPTVGVPPFGLGLRPARGPLGRLRDGLLRRFQVDTFDKQGRVPINAARDALRLATACERVRSSRAR